MEECGFEMMYHSARFGVDDIRNGQRRWEEWTAILMFVVCCLLTRSSRVKPSTGNLS